jgi:hypothetical protein
MYSITVYCIPVSTVQLHASQQVPKSIFCRVAIAVPLIATFWIGAEQGWWGFQAHCALAFDCVLQSSQSVIKLQKLWAYWKSGSECGSCVLQYTEQDRGFQ